MQRQSSTFGWKLTFVLSLMAGLKILTLLATMANGAYWALLVLGSAGAISALVLTASASLQVRPEKRMLAWSRRFADASRRRVATGPFAAHDASAQAVALAETSYSRFEAGNCKTPAVIDDMAFQTNILALNDALGALGSAEAGMAAEELQEDRGRASSIEKLTADSDATAGLNVMIESVRSLTSENHLPVIELADSHRPIDHAVQANAAGQRSATENEHLASHSHSLWSLVDKVQRLSGVSAAPGPTWTPEAEDRIEPVGILISVPVRNDSRRDS